MTVSRVRVRYTGLVQGVGFRASARAIAQGFAVTGWVRNEADGSVLLEAQGKPAEVERFLGQISHELEHRIRFQERTAAGTVEAERGFAIAR